MVIKAKDDLEAVRLVAQALEGFTSEDQQRIIRWAMEKVGLSTSSISNNTISVGPQNLSPPQSVSQAITDIKSFIAEKNPQNDNHFAATVAYYYRFQAPADQRKDEIGSDDLQEACRLSGRSRLTSPNRTLNNALSTGLLNRGSRGKFVLNTVGENLVAMSLPISGSFQSKKTVRKGKK